MCASPLSAAFFFEEGARAGLVSHVVLVATVDQPSPVFCKPDLVYRLVKEGMFSCELCVPGVACRRVCYVHDVAVWSCALT
jgi:hypothetical protein